MSYIILNNLKKINIYFLYVYLLMHVIAEYLYLIRYYLYDLYLYLVACYVPVLGVLGFPMSK